MLEASIDKRCERKRQRRPVHSEDRLAAGHV
jgi:hypothetical protein